MTARIAPDFTRKASKLNGFYTGPALQDGIHGVVDHLDQTSRVRMLETAQDGSVKLAIDFRVDKENPRNNLSTEVAFIRNPGDWNGHDHHIIGSTQFGCNHGCVMCVDGLPATWRGQLSAEQMAYAAYKALEEASRVAPIAANARIKLLQTGSGDPFINAAQVAPFIENVHNVDERIVHLYTSTAGRITELQRIVDAANNAKQNGVIITSQFSTHNMEPAERADLIPNPRTTALQQLEAAEEFANKTGNESYINYMVVPGWNDSEEDAQLLADNIGPNSTLKLVALNAVNDLQGMSDDKGNMLVLKFDPVLVGKLDGFGNTIKQVVIPQYLQVACTEEDVASFRAKVEEARSAKPDASFKIISPKDNASVVNAACGKVGQDVMTEQYVAIGQLRKSHNLPIVPLGAIAQNDAPSASVN